MSSRRLTVLGSSSHVPTRLRAHNGYVLHWDDQHILFDPGEGTQRQITLAAGVSVAKLTAICITHFHGDHCLGLPGVMQRRSSDILNNPSFDPDEPLPIFFPGDGVEYFERMKTVTISHDIVGVRARPIDGPGLLGSIGELSLSAGELDHRCTTYGYRLDEPDGFSVVPERLAESGLQGAAVGTVLEHGWVEGPKGRVRREDITEPRRGQSMAFVMDTRMCSGALELARDVDLLVCESTYLHEHRELAEQYAHMTAEQAGELAAAAGARRLLLTHFSARYPDAEVMGDEARRFHDDVVVAHDLISVDVPGRR